jgi:CubicO group peptidase (beta-lactamase class C family)
MRMLPRAAEPGTVFTYKTGETDMAGILVAYATGRGLAQYLSEKIWAPYGMERDAIWIVDRSSIERGGCCISMTLRDYARVGLFVLSGGMAGGKRVVPEWYLKDATSNRIMPPATGSYGYFWWIAPDASFSARGIFGQMIQIVPQQSLIVVTNAAFPSAVSQEYSAALTSVVSAVRAATE